MAGSPSPLLSCTGGGGGADSLGEGRGAPTALGKPEKALTSTPVLRQLPSPAASCRRTVLIRSSLRLRTASPSCPAAWGPLPAGRMGAKSMAASSLSTSVSFCAWTTFLFPARFREEPEVAVHRPE